MKPALRRLCDSFSHDLDNSAIQPRPGHRCRDVSVVDAVTAEVAVCQGLMNRDRERKATERALEKQKAAAGDEAARLRALRTKWVKAASKRRPSILHAPTRANPQATQDF